MATNNALLPEARESFVGEPPARRACGTRVESVRELIRRDHARQHFGALPFEGAGFGPARPARPAGRTATMQEADRA